MISYERAIELLKSSLNYLIEDTLQIEYALLEAQEIGFCYDEIRELGFECMFDVEEE